MSFGKKAAYQPGWPVAVLKTVDRKKLMRVSSHPRHNLLRREGRWEAMAEGKSIMTLLYPSGLQCTGPASPSSTSLGDNKLGGRLRGSEVA